MDIKIYLFLNSQFFFNKSIHKDAERIFLIQQKQEPVENCYVYIKKVFASLNIRYSTPVNIVMSLKI
jgi:hypothetical protein